MKDKAVGRPRIWTRPCGVLVLKLDDGTKLVLGEVTNVEVSADALPWEPKRWWRDRMATVVIETDTSKAKRRKGTR